MGKKKTIGSGKSKHWTGRRRITNRTRKLQSRIKRLNPAAQEKILSVTNIGRRREK
jgi:hypothetical protein